MRFDLTTPSGTAYVDQISTPSLGNHSYVINVDGAVAVIDPQRDAERFNPAIDDGDVVVVCETHIHNDYVSGGFWLARDTSATYVLPAGSGAPYEHRAAAHGDRVVLGDMWLEVVDTPGHTFHHASYVLAGPEGPVAVFSGGSMLVAAVGRSDLVGPDATDELLGLQYRSVTGLANELPVDVVVAPTHGAGSFCSASDVSGTTSTIAAERRQNPACIAPTLDDFVRTQKAGYGLYPIYYSHMAEVNLTPGPRPPDAELPSMTPTEAIASGRDIVDVRPFEEYAAGHIAGSISTPPSDQDATYVAWTLPWNTPIVIVGPASGASLLREHLMRLGWDAIDGVVDPAGLKELGSEMISTSTPATFAEMVAEAPQHIIDVRDPTDHAQGIVRDATPSHVSVVARDGLDIPGQHVWVHCEGGYRAMVATGFLEREGYTVTTVIDSAPADLSAVL
jgi:glyoxylase-like metal-dependent hydrolase (beta-lactamase superfamily II)